MSIQQEKFKAIADKIRGHLGTTDLIKPNEFADKIDVVAEEKYAAGIEQGKQAQYDEFWDAYQNNGKRKDYESAFRFWQDEMFYPKYDIVPNGSPASYMFFRFGVNVNFSPTPFNLSERLKQCNVELDTSKATNLQYAFSASGITQIPEVSTMGVTTIAYMCYSASLLQTAENIVLKEDGSQLLSSTFAGCTALENIMIGAPRKGATCSELITVPFNEAFEEPAGEFAFFKQGLVDAYREYFNGDNEETGLYTCICFETGEKRGSAYYHPTEGWGFEVPSWWIPEDRTQNVSFYLAKNEDDAFTREAIGKSVTFKDCPLLSRKSIGCIVSALLSTAQTGATLTFKQSAVETAFGSLESSEWYRLIMDKSNQYDGNWTINLV